MTFKSNGPTQILFSATYAKDMIVQNLRIVQWKATRILFAFWEKPEGWGLVQPG